ncbi:MAG: hypothetical protein FJX18_01480 [Alphaproteobacteria bacterium]|nr:hypothetical protein [Alphaproteobacteria bacterium]
MREKQNLLLIFLLLEQEIQHVQQLKVTFVKANVQKVFVVQMPFMGQLVCGRVGEIHPSKPFQEFSNAMWNLLDGLFMEQLLIKSTPVPQKNHSDPEVVKS